MVTINLKQYMREYEAAHHRDVTWAEIKDATGLAESTINRMMNHKAERVDLDVLDRLCTFFGHPAGPVQWIIYSPGDK